MEDTTGRSAPGGYIGQADLTGTEDTAGSEHRLVTPGRRYERGGHDFGESAPTLNGTISTDCNRDGI
jgi:hypothetical protein